MIAFGRPRLLLVAAALLLAVPRGGDGAEVSSGSPVAAVSTTTTTTDTDAGEPRTSTTVGPDQASTTAPSSSTTSLADGESTTTTTGPPGVATTSATPAPAAPRTTTTTAPAPSPCPAGGLVWNAGMDASPDGPDTWVVTLSGSGRNESNATIEVGALRLDVEITPPDGGGSEVRRLHGDASPSTLGPGSVASFSGSERVRSTTAPRLVASSVDSRWADSQHRGRCASP